MFLCLLPTGSCPTGEDIMQISTDTYTLPACNEQSEPSCYIARLLTYSFWSGPCGFADTMADSEPTGAASSQCYLLFDCLLDNLQEHNSPSGRRWLSMPLVFFSLFQMLLYYQYHSIKTLIESCLLLFW